MQNFHGGGNSQMYAFILPKNIRQGQLPGTIIRNNGTKNLS